MWINDFFGNIPLVDQLDSRKLAKHEGDIEFRNQISRYITSALDIFEWDLPETCNPRYLELSLLYRGQALFAMENGSLLSLASVPNAEFNLYGEPIKSYGYGLNGWNKEYQLYIDGGDESYDVMKSVSGRQFEQNDTNRDGMAVLCRDNDIMFPYILYLFAECKRITNVQRSIDTALINLKQNKILACEESFKNAVIEVMDDVYSNKPYIVGSKGFNKNLSDLNVIDVSSDPAIIDAMWSSYNKSEYKLDSILGFDCMYNQDKKAQMLSSEVSGNNQRLEVALNKRLKNREKACEQLYDCFGIYGSVKLKYELTDDNFIDTNAKLEGGEE